MVKRVNYVTAARIGETRAMRITAKADYAVRAAAELAAVEAEGVPMKGELLARSQGIHQFGTRCFRSAEEPQFPAVVTT